MNLHKSNIELYKMHLNENFTHYWSAESLSDKTINVLAAKEYLLHKGIIYEKGSNATKLNPLLFNITNFDDALLFIENQEKKLDSSNITQNFISENYGQVGGHQSSFESALISPFIQKNKNPNKQAKTKTSPIEIASWIFGIIGAILAIYEFIKRI